MLYSSSRLDGSSLLRWWSPPPILILDHLNYSQMNEWCQISFQPSWREITSSIATDWCKVKLWFVTVLSKNTDRLTNKEADGRVIRSIRHATQMTKNETRRNTPGLVSTSADAEKLQFFATRISIQTISKQFLAFGSNYQVSQQVLDRNLAKNR